MAHLRELRLLSALRRALDSSAASPRVSALLLWLFCGGACYGLVLGSRNLLSGRVDPQPLYAALKVPLLSWVTFALCLPSFYVLNALLGLRDEFGRVVAALVRAQAVFGLVLASLAPLTLLCYLSSASYARALLFNGAMFGVATLAAQWALRRLYRPLIAIRPRHRWAQRLWLVLYAFTGIQLGWVLRPFVGSPQGPSAFFRPDAWGNAYVVLFRLVQAALGVL